MSTSHVGDDATVGFHDVDKSLDVAGMACAHLHDSDLMVLGEAQQGLGHADVVVEVALREEHVVTLAQDGSKQLLGCGLAVGACDAYNLCAEGAAVMQGKLLQGVQTVVGEDEPRVALNGIFGLVDHGVGAALVKSCCCKLVAVERFALEREEDASFGTVATVGCDNGVLLENFVKLCYVHCFSIFFCFVLSLFRSFSVLALSTLRLSLRVLA